MRVSLHDVGMTFATTGEVLRGISVDLAPGSFTAILGASGCGKTTLLRLIAGLESPTAGSVVADGDGPVSYVFQEARLLPWRRALANVELPLQIAPDARMSSAARRSAATGALARVGLADRIAAFPSELSGGMRMRVSLARALVTQPRLLLLDEPFGALDELTRESLNAQLRELWRDAGFTTVFVTHNVFEATFLADRVLVMGRGPGRIAADLAVTLGERTPELRGTAEYAATVGALSAALREAS
jgi:NitT/TauT family transport system ATP-binding protein